MLIAAYILFLILVGLVALSLLGLTIKEKELEADAHDPYSHE